MADSIENPGITPEKEADKSVGEYLKVLSQEHKMLLILKKQLYENRWEPMVDDLQNRLSGKPYIFKLASRIQDDVCRIRQLQEFERQHDINLADFVENG